MKAVKQCRDCGEVDAELKRLVCSNGAIQVKFQCPKCGGAIGNAVPHGRVGSIEELAEWDSRIRAEFLASQHQAREIWRDIDLMQKRAQYREYLQSPRWRSKRNLVLARAQGTCEGCMSAPADEVHHLTYAHIYEEFLFELVALCRKCHARWHGETPNAPDFVTLEVQ